MRTEQERKIDYTALSRKVLAVAVEGDINDWVAYIGSVAGINHSQEWQEVRKYGAKLHKKIAEILFPSFTHLSYRW